MSTIEEAPHSVAPPSRTQVSYPPVSHMHLSSSRPFSGGRLGTYTALGAAAASVPLPWVPAAIVRRVRGALVHDIAARHGLSLTAEARTVLVDGESEPNGPIVRRVAVSAARYAARFVLGRIGPLGLLPPVRSALATFALGHLFQRYAEGLRYERSVRIDLDEAIRIRRAIEQAYLRIITDDPAGAGLLVERPPEELRDGTTKLLDAAVMAVASLPEWLTARLDAAFDEAIISSNNAPRRGAGPASSSATTGARGRASRT